MAKYRPGSAERPKCECHDEFMYWHPNKSTKAGGSWRCRIRQAAPCLKCGTEPRLEGHVVCSRDHVEERCPKCHPELAYAAPANQSWGALTTESEEGWTY